MAAESAREEERARERERRDSQQPGRTGAVRGAIPPGWSYNPSDPKVRHWLLVPEVLGLATAIYITLFQFGAIPPIWDPFFGIQSSYLVTHSSVAHIVPFPDAALGVVGYLCDIIFGLIGGPDRWRAKPWAALLFVGTIAGLAVVSTLLVITMAVFVQHWCTLCLLSAVCSIIIFSVGFGEALPVLQYLKRVWVRTRAVGTVWQAIWGRAPDVVTSY
jgi:uncharacterized membrane protein